ncbi:hypothetical protein L289_1062 [Acinetobacter gerneri DSM 14967 = CIP 107464 = MTCC 9824]|uniref:Uncharacterized protein n=1 Tax=Acinetobacter gerneri DSM 14967 = CIP 107464 = MTCC 9824 TaxID=1120926 RepID=N8YA53_9GAMM|nr:hypothetical protein F960_02540 [Acinetobacter gerneri DSM 14967 = CIP 107464 = MTCC 9824]EPR84810.1 hypothetical protein L289_1062 [Acinetobacter gerneri DSM 14967 = CIP 107464 = MTCC 9824]
MPKQITNLIFSLSYGGNSMVFKHKQKLRADVENKQPL